MDINKDQRLSLSNVSNSGARFSSVTGRKPLLRYDVRKADAFRLAEPAPLSPPKFDSFSSYLRHMQSNELTVDQCTNLRRNIGETLKNEQEVFSVAKANKAGEYNGFFNSKIDVLDKELKDVEESHDLEIAKNESLITAAESIMNKSINVARLTTEAIAKLQKDKEAATTEFFRLCEVGIALKDAKQKKMDEINAKIDKLSVRRLDCQWYLSHDYTLFASSITNHANSFSPVVREKF